MAYTSPKTWSSEVLTDTDLNTYIRDNQIALKDPPSSDYQVNEGSDYTTTSTSFADVDATNLALSITTTGGDVVVSFFASVGNSASSIIHFNVDVDGSPFAADDGCFGIATTGASAVRHAIAFTILVTGLSATSHTFKIQWKVVAGTATMWAGAGTSNADVHPQMWAREVS